MNHHPQGTFHPLCVSALANSLTTRNPVQTQPTSTFESVSHASRSASQGGVTEQRISIRYVVTLSVRFQWTDRTGTIRKAEGYTRNLSSKGAFISVAQCPAVGTSVQIAFQLSPGLSGSRPLHLDAEGLVLRIEPESSRPGNRGFAVEMRRTRVQMR